MKIIECEQGTIEWKRARAGVITASMVKDVRDTLKSGKNKGGYKKKADDYAFQLACERMCGDLLDDDHFVTWQMKRGNELEPEARLAHENARGILVEQCGLVLTDDNRFGASLDGLIDDDGGCEYKCFTAPSSIKPILLDKDLSDIKDQMQCGLWVTGRSYFEFCLYCPQLKKIGHDLTIIRVERDDEYIEKMVEDLLVFDKHVEKYIELLTKEDKNNTKEEINSIVFDDFM